MTFTVLNQNNSTLKSNLSINNQVLTSFIEHIKKENLFSLTDNVLLTVSGGIDSILMCELFHKAGLKFGIAHCNFQLRSEESDGDETFVTTLAEKYNTPFHSVTFNTAAYAKKNKLSIQVAARQLRYHWFEEVRENCNYKYIATAHHQDDSIETFFINFIRGTGISGLHGILPKQGNIIRPLLFTTKKEIQAYAVRHKLKYREDSSNASDKYVRNKIRHFITPVLTELNPGIEKTFIKNIQHLRDVELIFREEIETKRAKIVKQGKSCVFISIKLLKTLNPITTYLYEFLKSFNFNASTVDEIVSALDGESGKQFFSNSHRLIKDRDLLILEAKMEKPEVRTGKREARNKNRESAINKQQIGNKIVGNSFKILKNKENIGIDSFKLRFRKLSNFPNYKPQAIITIANLDYEKLEFPLEIRKWQIGDVFYPLGMKGKKKLSDFFIDKKLSINQKENVWLLTSAGKIVWIIGLRIDERFKITEKTRKIYFVELV